MLKTKRYSNALSSPVNVNVPSVVPPTLCEMFTVSILPRPAAQSQRQALTLRTFTKSLWDACYPQAWDRRRRGKPLSLPVCR